MVLYYSGADRAAMAQNQPEKSLGGYISSSLIPNGIINAIFSTISKSVAEKQTRDTRLIVLTNTTGSICHDVKIYIEQTPDTVSNIKMAAVSPATDSCSNLFFELIPSADALPYQATLSLHNGVDNAIDVGDLAVGETIGIWLSREIIPEEFPSTKGLSQDAINEMYNQLNGNFLTEDESNLKIDWN